MPTFFNGPGFKAYLDAVVDPLADAVAWKKANPEAYRQIVTWAMEDRKHGARPSIALYVELLRRPHFANRLRLQRSSVIFLINNDIRASLSRIINREYNLNFPIREAKSDFWEHVYGGNSGDDD